ncbi:MAG: glycine C-acetyltransferase [Nitrospirae bacterium RBG_16_64_22]|nr:MAG: glycine C-acetyltransferase [Nitrospirae bacterium RBG_16_64_22]
MVLPIRVFQEELNKIRAEGLYKEERVITSPQGVEIRTLESGTVLNFCANNYLGLANHPAIVEAAARALQDHGFGMASVRFICGTQDIHRELENTIAGFFQADDAILYTSCFDANTGLFETILGPEDAVISDALNHASIIDGIRLCKAARFRYAHGDMDDLEARLKEAGDRRIRLIATDGVFSMDGDMARLDRIVGLARKHDALVMVDDSHATGVVGPSGRGTAEHYGVTNEIDITTSTLGKAMGGASGGFTAGRKPIVDLLRQRSRPYLFSNTLTPALAAAGIRTFHLVSEAGGLRERLRENTRYFREEITRAGFEIKPGEHPIVPVMLFEAPLAQKMAADLLREGIYVVGFFYPVVPKGEARIRVQISAAHEKRHLDEALSTFARVGRKLGVIR